MNTASTETVAIVIPVYNGGDSFRRCLASIRDSQSPPEEVIVVADGDTDGSWQVAEAFGAHVIRLPQSGGPARARNLGASAATSDIIFFVDADVTLHPETVMRVRQRFQRHPELAALIGSYDDAPGAHNFLSQYKNLFHHYVHQTGSEMASTFWGACGAVRRPVFEAAGGFDERYRRPCIEDIELGYRLKRAGYALRLCKEIQVKHLKRWEFASLLRAEILYRALPWTELILRDRQLEADLNLNHASRWSVILTFGLVASALVGVFHGAWWGLTAGAAIALLVINWDVYQFFWRQRGAWFALRVVPWHWFYYFYGGGTFAYGMVIHQLKRLRFVVVAKPSRVRKLP